MVTDAKQHVNLARSRAPLHAVVLQSQRDALNRRLNAISMSHPTVSANSNANETVPPRASTSSSTRFWPPSRWFGRGRMLLQYSRRMSA